MGEKGDRFKHRRCLVAARDQIRHCPVLRVHLQLHRTAETAYTNAVTARLCLIVGSQTHPSRAPLPRTAATAMMTGRPLMTRSQSSSESVLTSS
jgi:hypothetical protein